MDAARFARIENLVDQALERPADERQAWLREACGKDAELLEQASRFLAAIDASAGFLEPSGASSPEPSGLAGTLAGPWRLVRLLGRGGAGEVWLAERADGRYQQQVAVKLLRHWGDGTATRFEREQALLARLEHPGIARLIDAGSTSDGQPFMVMEYIDGRTLVEHCETAGLSIAQRLELFEQICDAVAYAHRHLVVHCDLKPQNILVRADGRVALLDFGIARLVDIEEGESGEAHTRTIRLTPQYAAPEQLAGQPQSTLTDVYSLGLLLHELLAGRSPWGDLVGQGAMAIMQRAMSGPPPAPSTQARTPGLARRLRGDLDAIVGKALRPEPGQRYASVEAMREELERHRQLRPVRARGDAFSYRLRRGLRRYWLAAAVSFVLVASALAGSVGVMQAQRQAERERDIAQTEARRAKSVRDALAHMFRDAGQQSGDGMALTAEQIFAQAAERIDRDFSDDPATAGQVLHALGELHLYLNDYAGAEPLLRNWLEREEAIADPAAAADVRSALAEALFRMGQADEAVELLHAAQSFWQADASRHADRLLTSRMLQSQLERQRGDVELGIQTLEATVPLRLQRSGEVHFETAALFSNLGAAYIQAGRIEEGIEASQRAMKLWRALGLDNGNDALNTLNNLAAAYFRSGDLDQAGASFEQALQIRRQAYGPSAATAALIGNYARVMQQRNETGAALALIQEAEPMALAHAGPDSLLTLSLKITRAELLVSTGRLADADEVLETLESASGLPPPLKQRIDQARDAQRGGPGRTAP
ncbi:protein kinase [Arenimonas sp.]|uniref:protein kinase domain-containing protein n=1 Tax=Arenimonas sp. TaxID=1872635 RepID=UPI0035AD89F2